ncbi:hypothetical protein [Curtobacterium sp. MCPF17_046]|uniref:hypothetical protein n=1 Tax=Curtobacterium sp. MCPF17_046 TaxID=2175663 RepID=UPI000D96FABF|nr:hypothetical protein [Curtobacterium sp. MCPF17_046]PYY37389.1 hypothetical protein DEJ32_11755 [Curtobacterium sp. MCPF17_046]
MPAVPITLVSALHDVDAARIAARLSDGHRLHAAGSAMAATRAVADRAGRLADVCGPGARHALVVTLPVGGDARAVGMMLANAARAETGDDRVLRHVVSVLRADEVEHLFWSGADDAFVAGERLAALVEYATVIVLDRHRARPHRPPAHGTASSPRRPPAPLRAVRRGPRRRAGPQRRRPPDVERRRGPHARRERRVDAGPVDRG